MGVVQKISVRYSPGSIPQFHVFICTQVLNIDEFSEIHVVFSPVFQLQ